MADASLHSGHREKMYRRISEFGMDSLAEHEVLETLLYLTIPRADTNPLAHRLIGRFGSLAAVLDAPQAELAEVPGVGAKTARMLSMLPNYFRRYLVSAQTDGRGLYGTEAVGRYILPHFVGAEEEKVILLCLDNRYRPLACKCIHRGSVNAVEVSVRAVVKTALACRASCVVIAHNHPGGVAVPSKEDVRTTREIQRALEPLHVELLDHILVSDVGDGELRSLGDFVSFEESGLIERKDPEKVLMAAQIAKAAK